jgi:hypothetical protein
MKTLVFLALTSIAVLNLASCGTADSKSSGTADSASSGPAALAGKNILQPGDVGPDKPVGVKDLIEGVFADKDAWKEKEVSVNGYVSATSGAGGKFGYALTLKHDREASSGESIIGCYVPEGDLPQDMLGKTVEVKGKIGFTRDEGKVIHLKPCELKK